jgi:hypothetical protein
VALHDGNFKGVHGELEPDSNYHPPFCAKSVLKTSQTFHNNDRQWRIANFGPWILEIAMGVRVQLPLIERWRAFLAKNHLNDIVTMP